MGFYRTRNSFINILTNLGLTSNLRLVLDVGDSNSYNAAVQSVRWLDTSGNGYDFFRGTTGSSESTDPTFNGTAGQLSLNEYWSFDGTQFFTYDTTNETWMQNLHKAGAKYTFIGWVYIAGVGSGLIGDNGGSNAVGTGMHIIVGAANVLFVRCMNAGTPALDVFSAIATTTNAWCFVAVSLDEAAGAGGSFYFIDGTAETFNGTYTLPSVLGASQTLQIAARGNANLPIVTGSRMGIIAMLEGVALTQAQITSIYTQSLVWMSENYPTPYLPSAYKKQDVVAY